MFRTTRAFALRSRALSSAALLLFFGVALSGTGCDAILGIHDVQHDSTGGTGGTGGGTTVSTGGSAGGGGTGGTTVTSGGGGTGGSTIEMGDFAFGTTAPGTDLPLSGQAFLGVQISPMNGFSGDVKIDIKLPPSDVTFSGVTLPAGTLVGAVKIGAKASATLGQMFPITLVATSGKISHEATVQGVVTGTPGTLVDTFGAAGITSWSLALDDGNLYDVREVAQNKILVTGDKTPGLATQLAGARVLPAGGMDTTFGPNADGIVTGQFCSCTKPSVGRGVVRLLNGSVLMIGTGNKGSGYIDDIGLLRFKDNGAPDSIAGDNGLALIDLGGKESTSAIELTQDEQVIAVGATDQHAFVAKFSTQGYLDNVFGGGNGFVLPLGVGVPSGGKALALDAQGKILLAARVDVGGGDGDLAVLRLATSGSADPMWNGGQPTIYGGASEQTPIGIALQSDGKIIVVGSTAEGGAPAVIVLRFKDDGTPDASFGTAGKTVFPPSAGGDGPVDMTVLADGRILVGGNNGAGPFLMRFLADGTPDPTFGTGGVKTVFLGAEGVLESLTMGVQGRIILAGRRESQPVKGFVAKVWN